MKIIILGRWKFRLWMLQQQQQQPMEHSGLTTTPTTTARNNNNNNQNKKIEQTVRDECQSVSHRKRRMLSSVEDRHTFSQDKEEGSKSHCHC